MKQTPGKIFLADQRGKTKTAQGSRYSTFNFENYYQEHKQPFGSLYLLNEEVLAGHQSVALQVKQASHILIIPLTGAVQVQVNSGITNQIDVEELQVISIAAPSTLLFQNPYEEDFIHFLIIGLKADLLEDVSSSHLFRFEFQDLENQLAELIPTGKVPDTALNLPFSLSLGKFAGRQEVVYSLENPKALFFAFVISGAFEVEGRLLHEKDGLALWDTKEVELEALSHNAMVLIMQLEKTPANDSEWVLPSVSIL